MPPNTNLKRPRAAVPVVQARDHAHMGSLRVIEQFVRDKERLGGARDISALDAPGSAEGSEALRLIKRYIQQASAGRLPKPHIDDLVALKFTVSGKPLREALEPSTARIRPQRELTEAGPGASNADISLLETTRQRLHSAQVALQQAQNELAEAQRREGAAREQVASLEEDVRECEQRVRAGSSEDTPQADPGESGDGTVYLTTAELAARLKYDERTVRERLVDTALVKGRHYFQPFGRKLLFHWQNIESDMLAGNFNKGGLGDDL